MSKTHNYYPWIDKAIKELQEFIKQTKQELELFDKHIKEAKLIHRKENKNVTED